MAETAETINIPKTALLGIGNMAGAILQGLRAPEVKITHPITVTCRSTAKAAQYASAADINCYAVENTPDANIRAVQGAKVVLLGVKPWLTIELAKEIAPALDPDTIIVSVAAGITCAALEEALPAGQAVVRAMPNTPAHVGRAVTGIAAGSSVTPAQLEIVQQLFTTVGTAVIVPESQINAVTAISGSGPAYVCYFAEQLITAGVALGLSPAAAKELVVGTIAGTGELLARTGEEPAVLRRNVTSPNGTTEKAVQVLETAQWAELFTKAVQANVRRSEEIERGE